MSQVLEYLKITAEMMAECNKANRVEPGKFPYASQADFILRHGRAYTAIPWPKGRFKTRRGRMKQCFKNAFEWARDNRELTYVEGYALRYIPIHHAWCVDGDGNVIDPTWKDQHTCEYFGVPFKTRFVLDTILRTRVYSSMIDNWEDGHPLLTGKVHIQEAIAA